MASLGDVGDALRRVLDKIDQSMVADHTAADLAEQARELLAAAATGSTQADVEQYGDPQTRWLVAVALIRELRGCRFVPFNELRDTR